MKLGRKHLFLKCEWITTSHQIIDNSTVLLPKNENIPTRSASFFFKWRVWNAILKLFNEHKNHRIVHFKGNDVSNFELFLFNTGNIPNENYGFNALHWISIPSCLLGCQFVGNGNLILKLFLAVNFVENRNFIFT